MRHTRRIRRGWHATGQGARWKIGSNHDRDTSEIWLGGTEKRLQLIVLRTLQLACQLPVANLNHFALTLRNFDPNSHDLSHHPCGPPIEASILVLRLGRSLSTGTY